MENIFLLAKLFEDYKKWYRWYHDDAADYFDAGYHCAEIDAVIKGLKNIDERRWNDFLQTRLLHENEISKEENNG